MNRVNVYNNCLTKTRIVKTFKYVIDLIFGLNSFLMPIIATEWQNIYKNIKIKNNCPIGTKHTISNIYITFKLYYNSDFCKKFTFNLSYRIIPLIGKSNGSFYSKSKHFLLIIIALISSSVLMAQGKFSFDKGSLDVNYNIYNNDIYQSDYPIQYASFFASQEFSAGNLPFTLRGAYSSMSNTNSNGFYPNYFNVSFNSSNYKKLLLEKVNKVEEKAYYEEINKRNKKLLLKNQSNQIDSALTLYDEESIKKMIEETEIKRNNQTSEDSILYYTQILDELNDNRNSWENLKAIKSNNDKIYESIQINDSTDINYSKLNLHDFDSRKKEISERINLNRTERLAMSLEQINAGRFPFISNHFVSQNTFIDGIDLRIKPSQLFISGVYGKINTFNMPFVYLTETENAIISGGSFGFSFSKSRTEIYTYQIRRNGERINELIGLNHVTDFTKNISFDFTLSGSQYNINGADSSNIFYSESLYLEYPYNKNNFVHNILFQNKSIGFITGYALESKVNFKDFIKGNKFFVGYEYISPTYFSLTSPFLIKDISALCVGTEQLLLNNKIKISLTQRIKDKEISELYSYKSNWQSTTIRALYKPNRRVNLNVFYQINKRNYENASDNNQILNLSVLLTENKLLNSTHVFQSFYIENLSGNILKKILYDITIPISKQFDLGLGYSIGLQSENLIQVIKSDLSFNPGKNTVHTITASALQDEMCKEYFGGYRLRIPLAKKCITEVMAGYGSFMFVNPTTELLKYKSSLTGNIRLMYLW